TFSPKLVARFRLQHLLDDHPPREATQLRTVSLRPQPSIDERPKPLACHLRRRYSLHHGMLPEGLRRQPKARSPASLRQGASQTFFQQIYAFTLAEAMRYPTSGLERAPKFQINRNIKIRTNSAQSRASTKFPANRENNREFCKIRRFSAIFVSHQRVDSMGYSRIPYATKQGISKCISGNFFSRSREFL